jgi:hypothetical protein
VAKTGTEKHHQKEKKVKDHCMEGCGSDSDNSSEKKSKERFPRKKWLNLPFKLDRRKTC